MSAADTQRSTSLPALGYDKILQKRLTLSQKIREKGTFYEFYFAQKAKYTAPMKGDEQG